MLRNRAMTRDLTIATIRDRRRGTTIAGLGRVISTMVPMTTIAVRRPDTMTIVARLQATTTVRTMTTTAVRRLRRADAGLKRRVSFGTAAFLFF
jgi:hypothetical protein